MTPGTHRFVALDALRGLCAILVCLFHFHSASSVSDSAFVRASWQFVDFFFVLSGFVIAANYRERLEDGLSPWRFLGLRLGRLYPLHIFVLALFVATELALAGAGPAAGTRPAFDAVHAPVAIPLHLLMLHSVGLLPRLTWNDPAWSIAVEFWAYVVFAVVVPRVGRRRDLVWAMVALAAPLILLGVTPWGINVTWDWGLVRCLYGFALGVLCWSAWQRRDPWPLPRGVATALEVAALVSVVGFVIASDASRWTLLGPPVFAAAILVFADERGRVSRLLAARPLLFLGSLSYSIYLLHSFAQARLVDGLKLVQHLTGVALTTTTLHRGLPQTLAGATPLQGLVITLAMLLVVIFASMLTYRFVERPAMAWSRRMVLRQRRTAGEPVRA